MKSESARFEVRPRGAAEEAARTAPAWVRILGWAGGAFLGAILLVAAWAKALDPAAFAEQIRLEGLAFGLAPATMALAGVALEVGLGVALLLDLRRRPLLVVATLLVLFFLFLTGRTYWRAEHGIEPPAGSCGCFGNLVERTPAEAFWQDLVLLVPALALAWIGRPRPRGRGEAWRWGVVAAAAVVGVLFARAAPALPLDDLATRMKPGASLAGLCSGRGDARVCLDLVAPTITKGRHWVVIADPTDDAFAAVSETLNRYTLAGKEPPVTVLADISTEQANALFWKYAPAFDIHETPGALLRPLYRTLPRSFLVEDGRVTRTASGIADELAGSPNP